MLVGTPLPVILSVFRALGPPLWIRRVLVRAQEGQLEARCGFHPCRASPAEIVGRIVLRGHPLHAANACVKLLNHMVQYMTTRLGTSFAALSDATRRGVLEQLGRADASITDLAEKFHMTLTGMKKHVGVLEQAGLVTTKKIGRVRTCQLGPRRLEEETAWLERYRQRWDERFDELDKVVEELTRKEKSDERKNRK
jgi:DNA-binding transcriptional ArsR family regulator